ncbi:MAG: DUF4238 domain-containing protein [Anaerolineae bacterium]
MGHHYLPQHYLAGFSGQTDEGMIWFCDKKRSACTHAPIRAVANEKDYYRPDVEKALAQSIEKDANPILDAIRLRMPLDMAGKHLLSRYLAVMVVRVPRHRHRVDAHLDTVFESVFARLGLSVVLSRQDGTLGDAEAKQRMRRFCKMKQAFESDLEGFRSRAYQPRLFARLVQSINSMQWEFRVATGSRGYITCDNPVVFDERQGICAPRAEIVSPVCRSVLLVASPTSGVDLSYSDASDHEVERYNRQIFEAGTRFCYGSNREQLESLAGC